MLCLQCSGLFSALCRTGTRSDLFRRDSKSVTTNAVSGGGEGLELETTLCEVWSCTYNQITKKAPTRVLSWLKAATTQRRMGTPLPYGALLSFPKWVVQQLGDVADKQLSCYQTSELFSSGENKHFLIQTSLLIARCAVCCIHKLFCPAYLCRKPPQSSLHPLSVSHMIVSGVMMMECGLVTVSVSPHQYSDPDQLHSPPVSAMCSCAHTS